MARATRQHLLDAAVQLLIDEGRTGVTTGRLAKRAGVVQSAFYNHFASVDECVQAALAEIQRRVVTTADLIFQSVDGPGYTTPGRVDGLLVHVFEKAAVDPSFFRLLVQRHHEPDVAEAIEAVLSTMRDRTAASILHPDARTNSMCQAEADVAARMVVGVFLAGLEEVLNGADPMVVSRTCGTFMTLPVFAMVGIETEAIDAQVADQQVNPAAG